MSKPKYSIGVDFGGTYVKLALLRFTDQGYKIDGYSKFPTRNYNQQEMIEQLVIRIIKLKAESTYKGNIVTGVGIGVPGRVDFNNGIVCDLTNVPGWKNVKLKELLEKKIKVPVLVDNDANLMALAESKFGAAKGFKNCVCVTLGTGIGGGIILNGRVYRGGSFAAGEIGHMTINENGPLCACGNRGCAERYAGNRYILEEAIKRLKQGARSKLKDSLKGKYSDLTLEMLTDAARKRDPFSLILWQEIGEHIGVVLADVVNLLNPEIIVLGGGVANAGKLLLDPIRKVIKERAFKVSRHNFKVVLSKFKNKTGIIGAATIGIMSKEEL
ncbi:MAG: ROK family protein [Candidatus Omnitrophota bacterium]